MTGTLQYFASLGSAQRTLTEDYLLNRPPHAALLSGMRGIGKRTFARLLAQTALCTGIHPPCGTCGACRHFLSGSHPDLLVPPVAKEDRSIKVDHLREITRALSTHAFSGGRRVVLIEDADRMTAQAQNALLKALEEPEGGALFLLTADSETALLPTVRSRCRILRMQPWSESSIEKFLHEKGVPLERAHTLSDLCGGSPGAALEMNENREWWALRDLANKTFFSVKDPHDVPAASALLKETRDSAEELLSIVEKQTQILLEDAILKSTASENSAQSRSAEKILQNVFEARRYCASNVSWQAVCDRLLFLISEEHLSWQQS